MSKRQHFFVPLVLLGTTIALAWCDTAKGQIFVEEHAVTSQLLTAPALGTDLDGTIPLPLFDTHGGTRELLQVRFAWNLDAAWQVNWAANQTLNTVGAEVRYEVRYDSPVFLEDFGLNPGDLLWAFARGRTRPALAPAIVDMRNNSNLTPDRIPVPFADARVVANAASLPMFIGTGVVEWESDFRFDMQIRPFPGSNPPPFDPAIVESTQLHEMKLQVQMFYAYQNIPEPAGLSAMAMAGMLARRRRSDRGGARRRS